MAAHGPPFAYTAEEWAAICDVLHGAALPMRSPPSNQWANIPLRMPPFVSPASSEGQPRTEEWARLMLERAAREFIVKETAAGELQRRRPSRKEKLQAIDRLIARLMKAPTDGASKATAFAEFAAGVEAWAHAETVATAAEAAGRSYWAPPPRQHSRGATSSRAGRKPDANRDWLFERLLFIWTECGGKAHTSEKDERGGPLIRFLQAACDPIFKRASRIPLTAGQAREAVRKLLKERRPRGKP